MEGRSPGIDEWVHSSMFPVISYTPNELLQLRRVTKPRRRAQPRGACRLRSVGRTSASGPVVPASESRPSCASRCRCRRTSAQHGLRTPSVRRSRWLHTPCRNASRRRRPCGKRGAAHVHPAASRCAGAHHPRQRWPGAYHAKARVLRRHHCDRCRSTIAAVPPCRGGAVPTLPHGALQRRARIRQQTAAEAKDVCMHPTPVCELPAEAPRRGPYRRGRTF
jgi:hypothetical protein